MEYYVQSENKKESLSILVKTDTHKFSDFLHIPPTSFHFQTQLERLKIQRKTNTLTVIEYQNQSAINSMPA